MSTSTGRVRARRSAGSHKGTIAVTGATRGAGRALIERLAEGDSFDKVVAIDEHRGDVSSVTWRVTDVRDPALAARLSDVDVVVHLDVDVSPDSDAERRQADNIRGAQTVLTAAAAERVPLVVLVTSAMVYGASPDNPVPIGEDAPVVTEPDSGIAGDYLEIEQLAARTPLVHPGVEVTVLRPAALVGPGIDTVVTRHFEAPRLLAVSDAEPRWQFCHIDDLAAALEYAALGKVTGTLTVGSPGSLGLDAVEERTGKRRFELPASLTFGTAQRLNRIGVTPAPATELRYVVYPWVIDSATLTAAGWRAEYDNGAALEALLEESAGRHAALGRHLGKKEAAITATAAGATVAALGTAAIVRRARRRRR